MRFSEYHTHVLSLLVTIILLYYHTYLLSLLLTIILMYSHKRWFDEHNPGCDWYTFSKVSLNCVMLFGKRRQDIHGGYYRVAKTHRISYLCTSFSAKVTYI